MDLTYKIPLLIQSRKLIFGAVTRSGLEPSAAIAMQKEAQLLPLLLGFKDPKLIRYIGTDANSCIEAFRQKPIGF